MAKIKVKQIDDLSLANSLLTVGAGKVEFSGAPTDGGYVSGFGIVDGIIKPTFAALPAADIFSTGLISTPADATAGRTITLDDAYVWGLFDIAASTTDPTESNTFVTGITYDNTTGKFTYTTGTTVAAKNGELSIAFADSGISSGVIFSANEETNKTLTLAKVAGSGAAADVAVATGITGLEATTVQAALAELQGDITALQAIGPVETTVVAGKGIKVTDGAATGSNDHVYEVAADLVLAYDSDSKTITLKDTATTPNVFGTIDATAFIKDGMLQNAELVSNPEGQEPGEYIKLTFNSDAEQDPIYINVADLCDVYSADDKWLHLNGFKFEHKEVFADTMGNLGDETEKSYGLQESIENYDEETRTYTIQVPAVTVDRAGHIIEASTSDVAIKLPDERATTTKKVYTPAEKQLTGEGTFTVEAGACHFRMYMNGQLLDSDAYTASGNTVTYVPGNYVALEETDRMDLVYFIEEEITVLA